MVNLIIKHHLVDPLLIFNNFSLKFIFLDVLMLIDYSPDLVNQLNFPLKNWTKENFSFTMNANYQKLKNCLLYTKKKLRYGNQVANIGNVF